MDSVSNNSNIVVQSLVELLFSIAPGDFSSLVDQLTFNPGSGVQQDCATITVVSDITLEDDESFPVVLTTTDPDVIVSRNTAVVTITNDDSKYLCLTFLVITITASASS